ncbi:MAG: hypothetical protein H8E79_08700 [Desulfobulbaceae bacterium]|uniref:Uncharacterized protein n=1 Tax=Candidatus Desulfatifera sulfidica TaxID=2841691 RepID=A0A8J6TAR8_9BACT|nr:hypothetical protein [Candidatus Desulfatifera sulfidica]
MKKEVEMICVSDLEGFSQEKYEAAKKTIGEFLKKYGWEYGDCVIEEKGKVWCCKAAAIWFMIQDETLHDED